jgi:hypothetical protein
MLDYYELKATDHMMDNKANQIEEDFDAEEETLFKNLEKNPSHNTQKLRLPNRDRSNSLKKNIKKYERLSKRFNLNDSRENDFEGFEDELE